MILLMVALLSTASTHVLINGSPRDRICHAKGKRRGRPSVANTILLFMDILDAVLYKAEDRGVVQNLHRSGVRHGLSLYDDDVAMFLGRDMNELAATRSLLQHLVKPLA
jgi:hypothetical protein